jgi:hypothetical protein
MRSVSCEKVGRVVEAATDDEAAIVGVPGNTAKNVRNLQRLHPSGSAIAAAPSAT